MTRHTRKSHDKSRKIPCKFVPLLGWWKNTIRGSFTNTLSLWHIYVDDCKKLRAHLYAGNVNSIDGDDKNLYREWTPEDFLYGPYNFDINIPSGLPDTNDISLALLPDDSGFIVNPTSKKSANYATELQNEGILRQSKTDKNVLYVSYFETQYQNISELNEHSVLKLVKLCNKPNIISYENSNINFSDPIIMFKNMCDSNMFNGNMQVTKEVNSSDFPGWDKMVAYRNKLLTTGVKYNSIVKDVWKTVTPPASGRILLGQIIPPSTSIITKGPNGRHWGAKAVIKGFTSDRGFNKLNGNWKLSFFENRGTNSSPKFYDASHFDATDYTYYFNIDVDSSDLPEYDALIDGVATVEISYEPVNSNMNYYDFIGAINEFMNYNGFCTHWRPNFYIKRVNYSNKKFRFDLFDTFQELTQALVTPGIVGPDGGKVRAVLSSLRTRYRESTVGDRAYFGRFQFSLTSTGVVPNNDPSGINLTEKKFDYFIDIQNYLDPKNIYNIFWAVTGPVRPDVPITGELVSRTDGYYLNNGSKFIYDVAPFGSMGPKSNFKWQVAGDTPNNVYFGLIDSQYTNGETVGYFFSYNCGTADDSFGYSTLPEFVELGLPIGTGSWLPYFATMMTKLNSLGITKMIIDIRNNGGGYAGYGPAFATFFGGDRSGVLQSYSIADNGTAPLISQLEFANDGGFEILAQQSKFASVIDTEFTAKKFPKAIFRGANKKLVILDSIGAASGGDLFPHYFTNPDAKDYHDLGFGLICTIVGDVDSRLHGSVSAPLGMYYSSQTAIKSAKFGPIAPVFDTLEQGSIQTRAGSDQYQFSNQVKYTSPVHIINNNINNTYLLDTGYRTPYPLNPVDGGDNPFVLPLSTGKQQPDQNDNTTWRDIWIETAIIEAVGINGNKAVSLNSNDKQSAIIAKKVSEPLNMITEINPNCKSIEEKI